MGTDTTSKVSKLDFVNLLVAVTGCNVTVAVSWANKHYNSILDLYPLDTVVQTAPKISKMKPYGSSYKTLVKEADPELEALLAEEDAIEAESGYGPHKSAVLKKSGGFPWDDVLKTSVPKEEFGVGASVKEDPVITWDNVMYSYHSTHIPTPGFNLQDGAKHQIITGKTDLLTPKKKKGKGI